MKAGYKRVAIEAAIESGLFIRRSVGNVGRVSYKGRDNIVTDTDRKSEAIVIKKILKAFPGHSVLSEERRAIDASPHYKWIIDPIDGTTNFAHGFPFFASL
jgi:myo-inositol-1(or 4)-monophosphatase